jgi:hypothetical protein
LNNAVNKAYNQQIPEGLDRTPVVKKTDQISQAEGTPLPPIPE